MSNEPRSFVWYELMTTDLEAAKAFYGAVVGWKTQQFSEAHSDYTLFMAGEQAVAGGMQITDEMCGNASPGWAGYIGVDDTDAYAKKVEENGGTILRAPEDIPEVGRFAVVSDPHGAVFMLITPNGEPPQSPPAPDTLGLVGWRELQAGNGEEALAFYSKLFGWTETSAMDMGEIGFYRPFAAGGDAIGGIMTKMPDVPMPFWGFYFNVDNIQAAKERVLQNGGQILMVPHEVPGGSWIVVCMDPQSAVFSLVARPASSH